MPAAAGDGLLSEPTAASFGDDEPTTPPLSPEGTFLAAWVNASASRERIREFQHTKRVGSYLIGRKLGEGSFAKVREGLHVVTGEKVPSYCNAFRSSSPEQFPAKEPQAVFIRRPPQRRHYEPLARPLPLLPFWERTGPPPPS